MRQGAICWQERAKTWSEQSSEWLREMCVVQSSEVFCSSLRS
jgi:hypothetical protein